jgi:FtsP/CotA-like multicopper oxidase with cupredoxin domain
MSGTGLVKSELLGGDAGDIAYPYYLINGRIPAAPTTFTARPGQRIRIRFINAASDTAFRVALAGHSMTVTHTDGYPVVPT